MTVPVDITKVPSDESKYGNPSGITLGDVYESQAWRPQRPADARKMADMRLLLYQVMADAPPLHIKIFEGLRQGSTYTAASAQSWLNREYGIRMKQKEIESILQEVRGKYGKIVKEILS